jgi:phosphatidylserine/phosphatidylglycerophosphate/cardiolipin synthase-like enzyme
VAGVLESLRPLVALIGQADDPVVLAENLAGMAESGAPGPDISTALAREVTDRSLTASALLYAGVLDVTGERTAATALRLAQAHVLVAAATDDHWELVLTVPGFLRGTLSQLVATLGESARPRETGPAITEVAMSARDSLIVAAPYLHAAFIHVLSGSVERVLRAGGTATVITRALSLAAPERSSANVEAVAELRQAAERAKRAVTVRSWEETGLGIHFKVVIADGRLAYLGSANLTPGGALAHAEAGVILRGSRVANLSWWLAAVADELGRRRLPAG